MGLLSSKHTACKEHVKAEQRDEATQHFSLLSSCYSAHGKLFLVPYKSGNMKLRPMRTKSICTPKIPTVWETTT